MYAVMTKGISTYIFCFALTPSCIAVNNFMMKINAKYMWFPLIGLISLFTIFARYNGRALHTVLTYSCKICGTNVCLWESQKPVCLSLLFLCCVRFVINGPLTSVAAMVFHKHFCTIILFWFFCCVVVYLLCLCNGHLVKTEVSVPFGNASLAAFFALFLPSQFLKMSCHVFCFFIFLTVMFPDILTAYTLLNGFFSM